MSKLNKIFLAIIVALLFTALAEVVFIFVYKPTQTIPVPQTVLTTSSPTPVPEKKAINETFLSTISGWPAYPNERTTLTNDITGTITSISQPEKITMQTPQGPITQIFTYIRLAGPNKDVKFVGYRFTQQQWNNARVFNLNRSGDQTPIKISDLAPGDNIDISEIFNVNTSDGSLPDSIVINRIK